MGSTILENVITREIHLLDAASELSGLSIADPSSVAKNYNKLFVKSIEIVKDWTNPSNKIRTIQFKFTLKSDHPFYNEVYILEVDNQYGEFEVYEITK